VYYSVPLSNRVDTPESGWIHLKSWHTVCLIFGRDIQIILLLSVGLLCSDDECIEEMGSGDLDELSGSGYFSGSGSGYFEDVSLEEEMLFDSGE